MVKVLTISSVASFMLQFNVDNFEILRSLGVQTELACNFEEGNTCDRETVRRFRDWCKERGLICHHVDASRAVSHVSANMTAYRQLKKIVSEGHYDLIHCHTPMGGVLGRLVGHYAGVPVIYTVHGFHFYKGAPLKNWLLFYTAERMLALMTKHIITINREDYGYARRMIGDRAIYIPGIGLDTGRYTPNPEAREKQRRQLGLSDGDMMILDVGELIPRKNHRLALRAISQLRDKPYFEKIKFVICGKGDEMDALRQYAADLGIESKVLLAGFRSDIENMYNAADLFLFASSQEGLSVALMTAMSYGLPIVCTGIRGNVDLIRNGENGFIADTETDMAEAIDRFIRDPDLGRRLGQAACDTSKAFSVEHVHEKMEAIYRRLLNMA